MITEINEICKMAEEIAKNKYAVETADMLLRAGNMNYIEATNFVYNAFCKK